MDISPVRVEYYETDSGRCPFENWLESLAEHVQQTVDKRLNRLRLGLFGDSKYLGEGVHELRFHFGPGYRIYFGVHERTLVLILEAGSKRTQGADIELAKYFWRDYLRRIKK